METAKFAMEILPNIALIVFGVFIILNNKKVCERLIKEQSRFFKNYPSDESSKNFIRFMYIFVSSVWIIFSLYILFSKLWEKF
jgi:hypothetical protein